MRIIRNSLLIILFLTVSLWLINYLSPFFRQSSLDNASLQSIQVKEAMVKLAYILDKENWLSYALQPAEEMVRVISNAVIDKNYQISETDQFLYAIDYEVLDREDSVIKSGRFWHRGGQKLFEDQKSKRNYVSTSIYPAEANPLDSRIYILNLRGLDGAEKIRFKSAQFQQPIQNIVIRAYQKKRIAEHKLDFAWQRMGDLRRQQLAKVNVYGADIVTEQEQRQLVRNQWAPLGPLGIDGKDYIIQKLYVVREIENDLQLNVPPVPSSGLAIYPKRYGMISLPDEDNRLSLNWKFFNNASQIADTDKITIEWWGRPATRYKKWQVSLSSKKFSQAMESGVLRISADRPVVIRAWLNKLSQLTEITPKPAYLRLYSPAKPGLVYKVNHIRGFKTPYRFDLRAFAEQQSAMVSYQLLDKHKRIIKKGKISLQNSLSPYDSVVAETDRWLTDPKHIYFNLPRQISHIRFEAPPGVWISAFTRPKNLSHITIDPFIEDIHKQPVPVWFAVRPEQRKDYLIKGRSQLITIQRQPPQIDTQLLAGLYRWQQFLPEGSWKGRYILNALEDKQIFREEALSSRYIKLQPSQDYPLDFASRTGTNSLRPSIIYARNNHSPVYISLWLDNKLYFKTKITDKNGEFQLPYMNAGQHTLRIESTAENPRATSKNSSANPVDFFINYTRSEKNILLKRTAIEIPSTGLDFTILKENPNELLALRVYTHEPVQKTVSLRVKLNGIDGRHIGPFYDWSVGRRLYQLLPVEKPANPIMLNTEENIGNERLFFIPLGSDMPVNQSYNVHINTGAGEGAYVILTRTIPGLYPDRQMYPDIELETVK